MKRGAIIGFGSIGKLHLKASDGITDIVAICTAHQSNLEGVVGYTKYLDYHRLLEKEQLDYIDICLPHHLHFPVISEAVKKGLEVICEKPLVHSEEELSQLESLTTSRQVRIVTNHHWLYTPQYQALKNLISGGSVGKPIYVTIRVDARDAFWSAAWKSDAKTSRGGVFLDYGIHLCYVARWLLESNPVSVNADIRTVTFEKGHPDDFGRAVFEFENGSIFDLSCTAFNGTKRSFDWRRVECEKATLVLPRRALSPYIEVYWHDGKEEQVPIKPITDKEIVDEAERFRAEFIHAYSELLMDYSKGEFRNQGVLLPEVKKDLAMVFSAYNSAGSRERIKIAQ